MKGFNDRGALIPRHSDAVLVMGKVFEVELESLRCWSDDPPESVKKRRLSVGGKPHDLVFVSVIRKSQVHGHCTVQKSERMRKIDAFQLAPLQSTGVCKQCAGKVPHAIN